MLGLVGGAAEGRCRAPTKGDVREKTRTKKKTRTCIQRNHRVHCKDAGDVESQMGFARAGEPGSGCSQEERY